MATIAELAVNFTANTGGLDSGVSRAGSALQRFRSEAEKASYSVDKEFGKLNQVFSSIGINGHALAGSISKVGLAVAGLGAGASLAVLVSMFSQSVAGAAKLQEMSEKTGASIEKLSGIAQVAKIEGADMEAVSAGMAKLAVNMEASGGASKKMSDALGRIGLSLSDLKGKDTGTMFEMISRRMSEYGDSAGKTAVAVELFGKRGAELIPTMNLLGESGDLVTKTTTEQAVAADAYEKNLQRLQITKNALYKTVSMELLPSVNAFVKALIEANNETDGVRAGARELAADGTLKTWAENGALAVGYLIDSMQFLKRGMQETGLFFGALGAQVALLAQGQFSAAAQVMREFSADVAKISGAEYFTDKLQRQMVASPEEQAQKKTLTGGNTGSVANSAGDGFLNSLKARLTKGVSGEYAQLMQQAEEKGVKNQAAALIDQIRAMDEGISLKNYTKSLELATEEYRTQITQIGMTKDQIELMNVDTKMTVDLQKQIEQIERSKGALTAETRAEMEGQKKTAVETIQGLVKIRQESEKTFSGGANKAVSTFMENAENIGKQVETTFSNAFRNMEDAIVQFAITGKASFTNLANGIVADVMRIYTRMAITGLIGKVGGLFGGGMVTDTPYTSNATGVTTPLPEAHGDAFIGGRITAFASGGVVSRPTLFAMAGGAGLMGEAGPEAIMPLSRGSDGKLGVKASGGGGGNVTVNVVNQASGTEATTRESTDSMGNRQIEVLIANLVNKTISSGRADQAMKQAYNLRRVGK